MTLSDRAPGAAVLALAAVAGCGRVPPSYDDPAPEARLGAIGRTVETASRADIPRLIENLAADDAAVRLAAAGALRRLTGETLGYRFDAPEQERNAAIGRWEEWVQAHPATP